MLWYYCSCHSPAGRSTPHSPTTPVSPASVHPFHHSRARLVLAARDWPRLSTHSNTLAPSYTRHASCSPRSRFIRLGPVYLAACFTIEILNTSSIGEYTTTDATTTKPTLEDIDLYVYMDVGVDVPLNSIVDMHSMEPLSLDSAISINDPLSEPLSRSYFMPIPSPSYRIHIRRSSLVAGWNTTDTPMSSSLDTPMHLSGGDGGDYAIM